MKKIRYLYNLLYFNYIKVFLEKSSLIYISLSRIKNSGKRYETKIAKKYFDLIVDGFPRSANSYSTRLFQHLEPRFLIGNHLHSVAHINYGIKKSIPTIVLIRKPKDAIVSLAALDIIEIYSGNKNKFFKENSLKWIINRYIYFYKPLIRNADKFFLLEFELITKDPIKAIKRINDNFNLNLESDPQIINFYDTLISSKAKSHLKPSEKRNQIKQELIHEINFNNDLIESLNEANKIYNKLLKLSNR